MISLDPVMCFSMVRPKTLIPVNVADVIDVVDVDKVITLSLQNHCTTDVTK